MSGRSLGGGGEQQGWRMEDGEWPFYRPIKGKGEGDTESPGLGTNYYQELSFLLSLSNLC